MFGCRASPTSQPAHLFRANTIRFLEKTLATQHLTPQNDPKNDPDIWSEWKLNFCLQNWCDSPNQFQMRISQLLEELIHQNFRWEVDQRRQHQNLYLLANQDDLTPERFYYLGFISELKRILWHIGNHWNRNGFGDQPFTIGFVLRITWTFVWSYDMAGTHVPVVSTSSQSVAKSPSLAEGWPLLVRFGRQAGRVSQDGPSFLGQGLIWLGDICVVRELTDSQNSVNPLKPSVCPSVRPSVHPSVRPSVRLSIRPSVRPSAELSSLEY